MNRITLQGSDRRRRAPRVRLDQPIEVDFGGTTTVPARAVNVSVGGLFVAGCPVVNVGERLQCHMVFLPHEPVALDCRVVWVRTIVRSNEPTGMGLAFTEPRAPQLARISELIERLQLAQSWTGNAKMQFDPRCVSGTWLTESDSELFDGPGTDRWSLPKTYIVRLRGRPKLLFWLSVATLAIGVALLAALRHLR